jgi:hypothetical protein
MVFDTLNPVWCALEVNWGDEYDRNTPKRTKNAPRPECLQCGGMTESMSVAAHENDTDGIKYPVGIEFSTGVKSRGKQYHAFAPCSL